MQLSKLNRDHLLVALVTAIWLTFFLILIAPFDAAELSIGIRFKIMPVYGLISFIGYVLIIPFQSWLLKRMKPSVSFEIGFLLLFTTLVLFGSYAYYKSSIVNGDYSFEAFTIEIYYPIFLILLPIVVFGRWYINRQKPPEVFGSEKLILRGDNKLDVLQISESDLVCISSADNYVSISHLENGTLTRKLLRTTLKNMEIQVPHLTKVHRSHLVNPVHFKEWKNGSSILLTQMEVPVSKSFKQAAMALGNSSLNRADSPQSQ